MFILVYSFKIVIALIGFNGRALATSESGEQFDGLWEGIDRDDGSTVQITIVCGKKRDGKCWVIGRESFLNFCEKIGAGAGEGWYEGTGQLVKGNMRRLDVEFTMHCRDGSTLKFNPYFISNRNNKILIYGGEGFQDITLNRVSE
ncbi:MAG: hypothetical protein ACU84H_16460 [Gammaproteobacteria bacterium]